MKSPAIGLPAINTLCSDRRSGRDKGHDYPVGITEYVSEALSETPTAASWRDECEDPQQHARG